MGGARRPDPFEVAADEGPIILTRSELQRRTRERSRLAALKVAEEHGKVRTRAGATRGRFLVDMRVEREREREGETECLVALDWQREMESHYASDTHNHGAARPRDRQADRDRSRESEAPTRET